MRVKVYRDSTMSQAVQPSSKYVVDGQGQIRSIENSPQTDDVPPKGTTSNDDPTHIDLTGERYKTDWCDGGWNSSDWDYYPYWDNYTPSNNNKNSSEASPPKNLNARVLRAFDSADLENNQVNTEFLNNTVNNVRYP